MTIPSSTGVLRFLSPVLERSDTINSEPEPEIPPAELQRGVKEI